ncbi:MAG: hypothetical protein PHH08_04155 [Candidatus ainarchaeum sp.]|nr:hypothetical protein [Candidatus ainarchaeum sp.]
MDKKIFFIAVAILLALFSAPVLAADNNARNSTVCAYFFFSQGCPHCANVNAAFKAVEAKYANFDVNRIDMNGNAGLLHSLYEKYSVPKYAVDSQGNSIPVWDRGPVLFIGPEYRIGDFAMLDKWIESQVVKHETKGLPCPDRNFEGYPDENINLPVQAGNDANSDRNAGSAGLVPAGQDNAGVMIIGAAIVIVAVAIVLAFFWRQESKEKPVPESPEKIAEELTDQGPGTQKKEQKKQKKKKEEPIEGA